MIEQKCSELDNICKSILDHPNFCNVTTFDIYTIFRFVTSKKFNLKQKLNIDLKENESVNTYDEKDLKNLVLRINPYYKFDNTEKNAYYLSFYFFAKTIHARINEISKERHLPKYYVLLDCESKNYITNDELEVDGNMREAVFHNKEDVLKAANKYLEIYTFTQIIKSIEIHGINMDKQIVSTLKLSSRIISDDFTEEAAS